ncbi:MAG: hypothetical protein ABJL99_05850 [Aliishimia sp.]
MKARIWQTCGALCFALAFGALPAQADGPVCDGSVAGMGPLCAVIEQYCEPYLADPTTVSPDQLSPVPKPFRRYFEGPLTTHVIGYRETVWPNTLVLYMFDEPACEVITYGLDYSDLLPAYQEWRAGPGSGFAASSDFEPTSKVSMSRAYAATFLAAPRSDGRVTEITFNWNLNFAGLTRFRLSYQPLRDHTRDMMLEAME